MGLINEDDLEWTTLDDGGRHLERKQLAGPAGGDEIGCSLYELPEGNRSWPYHYHTANEEAIYVLDGTGTLRLDGETTTLEAGDYVALPAEERGAHQIVNDSPGDLRYLMLSTMTEPDVTVYPDSDKLSVFAGSPPGGSGDLTVSGSFRRDDAVDYWDGE
jgi:uncharacterized cupin superfamily protein